MVVGKLHTLRLGSPSPASVGFNNRFNTKVQQDAHCFQCATQPRHPPTVTALISLNDHSDTSRGDLKVKPKIPAVPKAAAAAAVVAETEPSSRQPAPAPAAKKVAYIPAVPQDVLTEFEHKLEADLQTVGVTLSAVLGVIIFWRGVWTLLDHYVEDSVFGDVVCILGGLTIVLYIRLSGLKIASFWPPS